MLNPGTFHYAASQAILALYKFESSAEPDGSEAMLQGQRRDETLIFSAMFYLSTLQQHSGGWKHVPTGNDIMAVARVARCFVCFVESRFREPLQQGACGFSAVPGVLKETTTASRSSCSIFFHLILITNLHVPSRFVRALDAALRYHEALTTARSAHETILDTSRLFVFF